MKPCLTKFFNCLDQRKGIHFCSLLMKSNFWMKLAWMGKAVIKRKKRRKNEKMWPLKFLECLYEITNNAKLSDGYEERLAYFLQEIKLVKSQKTTSEFRIFFSCSSYLFRDIQRHCVWLGSTHILVTTALQIMFLEKKTRNKYGIRCKSREKIFRIWNVKILERECRR